MKQRDLELISRYRAGDEEALEVLLDLYKPLILSRARKFFVPGLAGEDLIQEATIALYRAVETYDLESEIAFAPFASRVVNNRLIDRLRKAEKLNERLYNQAMSWEEAWPGQEDLGPEKMFSDGLDPEELVIQAEALNSLLDFFSAELSAYEAKVAAAKIDGQTYREIASRLGAKEKSIDAALQRVRRKLRQRLSES